MEEKMRTMEEILAEESQQPKCWWYLRFVDEERGLWLGGCVVLACGALQETWKLKINPGGGFMAIRLDNDQGTADMEPLGPHGETGLDFVAARLLADKERDREEAEGEQPDVDARTTATR